MGKPFITHNHVDKSKEIIVFDHHNQMYLISGSGNILWKIKLTNPLVGDVYQIDFYNNNKLQYLFSTAYQLQLIDRLGRNVANYPIRLSSTTTTGIAVYDIRKNNDPKYFIGCDNQKVFGYDKAGKPMAGWRPNSIKGNLLFPPKYFIKDNKVYVFGTCDKGYFYLWNYKGEELIKAVELQTKLTNPMQIIFENEFKEIKVFSIDSSGRLISIWMDGKVEIKQLGGWSNNSFMDYLDINEDGEKEIIICENKNIIGYSFSGQIIFSTNLDVSITHKPEFVKIDSKYYVAYLNEQFKQLFLVDLDGISYPGFPMECSNLFEFADIDGDGKVEVLGAVDNKIFLSRF